MLKVIGEKSSTGGPIQNYIAELIDAVTGEVNGADLRGSGA
jgi:hypothetical protein